MFVVESWIFIAELFLNTEGKTGKSKFCVYLPSLSINETHVKFKLSLYMFSENLNVKL